MNKFAKVVGITGLAAGMGYGAYNYANNTEPLKVQDTTEGVIEKTTSVASDILNGNHNTTDNFQSISKNKRYFLNLLSTVGNGSNNECTDDETSDSSNGYKEKVKLNAYGWLFPVGVHTVEKGIVTANLPIETHINGETTSNLGQVQNNLNNIVNKHNALTGFNDFLIKEEYKEEVYKASQENNGNWDIHSLIVNGKTVPTNNISCSEDCSIENIGNRILDDAERTKQELNDYFSDENIENENIFSNINSDVSLTGIKVQAFNNEEFRFIERMADQYNEKNNLSGEQEIVGEDILIYYYTDKSKLSTIEGTEQLESIIGKKESLITSIVAKTEVTKENLGVNYLASPLTLIFIYILYKLAKRRFRKKTS